MKVHVEIATPGVDPAHIQEGDSLNLRCNVRAHPWVWRVLWYRDGEELGPSEVTITDDEQTLRLTNVSKTQSGQYVCSASNVEGDGFSQPLRVAVKYKPVCVAPAIEYRNHSQVREVT